MFPRSQLYGTFALHRKQFGMRHSRPQWNSKTDVWTVKAPRRWTDQERDWILDNKASNLKSSIYVQDAQRTINYRGFVS